MAIDQELLYLVDLFDDDDSVVAKAVNCRIKARGEGVIRDLCTLMKDATMADKKEVIESRMQQYNRHFVLESLKSYAILAKKGEASLMEGCYLVCALFKAGLGRSEFYDIFLPMIGEISTEISPLKTAVENVRIFNHIFYKRYGFKASDPFSLGEHDSILINVINERKGNPVALSLIYFILAQACGLSIYPLCFTGGFVAVYEENGKVLFYLNIFHEGEIFMEQNLSSLIKQQGLPVEITDFQIKKDATIIVMYLEFLAGLYSMSEKNDKAALVEDAIHCFGSERFISIDEDEE